ncbi:hypothetical protein EVAR_59726_1 [Eumeta japonica]|uniref:Uncharacterized protein n=1 Tax=Eumeta variegata TaxID=151549 RepID=A0A4C1XLL2_EUMVA|nr:hypothetical protein EVAR_59726_1 [Eumeta japonica]
MRAVAELRVTPVLFQGAPMTSEDVMNEPKNNSWRHVAALVSVSVGGSLLPAAGYRQHISVAGGANTL